MNNRIIEKYKRQSDLKDFLVILVVVAAICVVAYFI